MKWLIFTLFFAAILADVYIYRSVICSHFRRLPARISYIIFALVSDGAALSAFALYAYASDHGPTGVMVVMWLVWLFFLTTISKLLYAAGGLLDFLVKLVARRRVVIFRGLALALSLVAVVTMVWGATFGRTRLKVNEVDICSDRVPAAFDGYRLVQISDIHLGTMPNAEKRLARLVEKIAGLQPDMVVSTGDLVNLQYTDLEPGMAAELSRLAAPDGVWSVWGNHDLGFYVRGDTILTPARHLERLAAKMDAMGWRTLANESVYIHRGGGTGADSILLSGTGYPQDNMLNGHNNTLADVDLAKTFSDPDGNPLAGDPFNIVLAHTPKLWGEVLAAGRGDLTLSGHTHAMQMKISLFGWRWSPAKYMYKEWSGPYQTTNEKNSMLYVNDGIGCVGYPMRIGARPEVTLFILKRCE